MLFKKFTILLGKYKFLLLINIILAIVPFFWLKPGEMDLGGDSNRLYFYDPLSNLKVLGIYSITSYGVGKLLFGQVYLPFLLFLTFIKFLFSATILIGIFNALKLSGSFIFMFLITKELFRKEGEEITLAQSAAAILGAIFYTFSPSVIDNMKYALVTHSQVFLNPMMFYLLLRYLKTNALRYLWFGLLITLIFSTNFSLQAPPPFFAFYPLAIFFLLLYNFFVLQKQIPWKGVISGALLFVGLHAFHLIPVASNVFDKGSQFNIRFFESTSSVNPGLGYFNAILPLGKVSRNILLPLENQRLGWTLVVIPALTILGFVFSKKSKTLLLVSFFFFTTLFLVSANITQIGVEFYRKLFSIPGFGMFRGFFGQWQWVYTFFYSLLVGLTISFLFSKIKRIYIYIISIVSVGFILARSLIVFNGEIVNVFHRGSKDVKVVVRMDPNYKQMLEYIKNIQNDGRIFHMPFTDYAYNIVGGANNGVYMGQSMVSFLAGKNDFSGYQNIDPYSEVFVKLVKDKNYSLIKQMMSLLQVRYILLNLDEKVTDKYFPTFPYGYTGTPTSQSSALDFVLSITNNKIYEVGNYFLYEIDKEHYLPKFYAPLDLFFYDTNPKFDQEYSRALSFFPTNFQDIKDFRVAFVDRKECRKIFAQEICDKDSFHQDLKDIEIIFQSINPTKYRLEIENATAPFLLVLQDDFSLHWKLYENNDSSGSDNIIDSYYGGKIIELKPVGELIDKNPFETNYKKLVYDKTHIEVNGYANAWYIKPGDLSNSDNHEFIVEMTAQKKFYYCLIVSVVTLFVFFIYGVIIFKK